MSNLFRRTFKTAMLKIATAASIFMNKVYNGRFLSEFSILMLDKNHYAILRLCIWN